MNAPTNTSSVPGENQGHAMKHECENHVECMKMIQAILDGEATDEEKEHFRLNMDKCIPCIQTFHLEKCIKESLQNKVEKRPCPGNLVAAIKAKINF